MCSAKMLEVNFCASSRSSNWVLDSADNARQNKNHPDGRILFRGDPTESRTPVARMKTWCPNH